ncbi:hypothetical protein [Streptomyces tirandamycinicus]|uniref:hypothetical protein n=1 Tax=Streptomyces tirandamycinicus TaxID=2174846 RepID=UPI0011B2472E|nr:hypothetical protein [Streptomyces tirandamycinicus]
MTKAEFHRALAFVLVPEPGAHTPLSDIRSAALAHMGLNYGVSYRMIKDALRAVGVTYHKRESEGFYFVENIGIAR